MDQAFKSVKKLVEDFGANERNYISPTYQESHVRQDFIDKFFTALGWDVTHERQKNPHEYEVRIENRVSGGGTQQRADYAFFLGPNFRDPKFFVEAKKPARQLENADFYYQTMRYGWNGNTPIAILTDFEELHVIDCRLKPTIKDAFSRRIKSFRYTDYADEEKFKWIYYLFSHEALADNSIEKFAEKLSKAKGKAVSRVGRSQPVDEVFLAELDSYRESLAKAFKSSNQELDGEELTEAVQRTIDRLVFIRFLEDKLIEEKEIVEFGSRKLGWELFANYCKKLEPKYNGLIFKSHPVIDSEKFNPPEEKVFGEICEGLAGRESPYNFDQIPISILGSIYERFLGKVVHATEKRVKIEDKPEVRKAGGVYYTPDYIVRYIVKETVGKAIEGKTPEEVSKMAFADIACGSGSFLIEVYDTLLQYHERYYTEHPEKAKKSDLQQREGRKVLSLKKRQEILTNNLYGVDIDYQATEVTQLSLYLKLLEDVTTNDAYQFSLLKEKILPDLRKNIVCGNSLIGTDMSEGNLFADVDEGKLKPMNFQDAFPEVMKRGGFDAVVGNPPYEKIQTIAKSDPAMPALLRSRYQSARSGNYDIYVAFLERGSSFLRKGGRLGYINPYKFLNSNYGAGLRTLLSKRRMVRRLIHFGDHQIFQGATTYTCLLFLSKEENEEIEVGKVTADLAPKDFLLKPHFFTIPSAKWTSEDWRVGDGRNDRLLEKIGVHTKLGELTSNIFQGPKAGADDVFILKYVRTAKAMTYCYSKSLDREVGLETAVLKKYIKSKFMKRYWIADTEEGEVTVFPYDKDRKLLQAETLRAIYPNTWQYLNNAKNKNILLKREDGRFARTWWAFSRPQNMGLLDKLKILTPFNAFGPSFALDKRGDFVFSAGVSGAYGILLRPDVSISYEYLLAILNSKLSFYYLKNISTALRGEFWSFENKYLLKLPIYVPDFSTPSGKARHLQIGAIVEGMLAAKEELSKAKTEGETTRLERECESLDRQIDQAVYELYGLTEEEIKVVEGK